MKKKILFIYPSMGVGGSTTSLMSVLNEIDYTRYDVDLIMFQLLGKLFKELPDQLHVLPMAYDSFIPFKLRKRLSLRCWKAVLSTTGCNRSQLIAQESARFGRKVQDKYDIAISFLEGWPLYYLVDKIQARKKYAWIHVNYKEAGFNPNCDKKYIEAVDKIVLVSDSCVEDFKQAFPEVAGKVMMIPNLLSDKVIRQRAQMSVQHEIDFGAVKDKVRFVSTCRLDCNHKGLDRGVRAFTNIKKEYVERGQDCPFIWYIIGDGKDRELLQNLIVQGNLQNEVILLGEKLNPLIYEKNCDVFFLPSHYEGKPMAVTEAQMLGLVPVVTNYSSANEQITNMVDGIVMDNDDAAIEAMLRHILENTAILQTLKEVVCRTNYSNMSDMNMVNGLLEEREG